MVRLVFLATPNLAVGESWPFSTTTLFSLPVFFYNWSFCHCFLRVLCLSSFALEKVWGLAAISYGFAVFLSLFNNASVSEHEKAPGTIHFGCRFSSDLREISEPVPERRRSGADCVQGRCSRSEGKARVLERRRQQPLWMDGREMQPQIQESH